MKKTHQINQNIKFIVIAFLITAIAFLMMLPKPEGRDQEIGDVSMNRYFQNSVIFTTELIGDYKRTEFSFPFSFENEPIDLWLGFEINDSQRQLSHKRFLIFHPLIQNLDWDRTRTGEITLYQRVNTHDSIDMFLKDSEENVYADPNFVTQYEEKNYNAITLDMDLSKADYILTTHIPVTRGIDGVYYYKNVLDTSNAKINEQGNISWGIYAPNATEESAYFRGQLDITYLQ